ncbi:MAG: DMT family transporter [bacterium]|nr:DMT family transporter [bacterium]
MLLVLFLYMLFASTFTLAKLVLDFVSPLFFIGIRMTLAGILLLSYQYFFDRYRWSFKREDRGLFVCIILFHIFFAYTLEFWALQYVTSIKTALIFTLSPFITAIGSFLFFGQGLTIKQSIGLFIGFVGIMPILLTHVKLEEFVGHLGVLSFPELALLGAVTSSCFGWIIVKKLVSKKNYSPVMVNGIGMFGGGLMALVAAPFFEGLSVLRVPIQYQNIWLSPFISNPWILSALMMIFYLVSLIFIANIICYNLYGFLLRRYSATLLSFAGFTTPLFTAFFGWLFLGEVISKQFIMSIVVLFCGLYLFYQDELKMYKKN